MAHSNAEPETGLHAHRARLVRYRTALHELARMIERGEDVRAISHAVQMLSQDVARGLVSLYEAPPPCGAEPSRALALDALTAVRDALRSRRSRLGSAERFREVVLRAQSVIERHEAEATRPR